MEQRQRQDEWLWYRIHQGFADMKAPELCCQVLSQLKSMDLEETVKPLGDVSAATEPSPDSRFLRDAFCLTPGSKVCVSVVVSSPRNTSVAARPWS